MVGAIILAHLVGDYIIQTSHMANEKTQRWLPAILHGVTYTLPFLFITLNPISLLIIAGTHAVIDHYRLAKHLIWFKNMFSPKRHHYKYKDATNGMPPGTPEWMSVFLMIVADNTLHILIAVACIMWIG